MRICKDCNLEKSLEEFPKSGTGYYRRQCKICYRIYQKSYRENNPEVKERIQQSWRNASKKYHTPERRRNKTLRNYGLTDLTYNEMFDNQLGKCLICGESVSLVVDHDHVTGKVRGLLCNHCNIGLGMFKDDLDRLEKAMIYLQGKNN